LYDKKSTLYDVHSLSFIVKAIMQAKSSNVKENVKEIVYSFNTHVKPECKYKKSAHLTSPNIVKHESTSLLKRAVCQHILNSD